MTSAKHSVQSAPRRVDHQVMQVVDQQSRAVRIAMSRHPVAVDCARAAATISQAASSVVVFENGRAFVAAAAGGVDMVPRPLTDAEQGLVDSGDSDTCDASGAAFAIRDGTGMLVGSLTIDAPAPTALLEALQSLARVLTATVSRQVEVAQTQSVEYLAMQGLRDAVFVLDADFKILWVNNAVGGILGRSSVELIGQSAAAMLHPDDVEYALHAALLLHDGLSPARLSLRLQRGDGGYERVEVTGADHSSDPTIGAIVLSARSVEVRDELESAVEQGRRMSDGIVSALHDGIVATDRYGTVTMVNKAAREIFDLDPSAPATRFDLADFAFVDERGASRNAAELPTSVDDDEGTPEQCVLSHAGDPRFVRIRRRSVSDGSDEKLGAVIIFDDVSAERAAAEQLRDQALHDQLTGLANRHQLEQRLSELAVQQPDAMVAACFVDLDGFKVVNDTHGHRTGDELVRIAARRLRAKLAEDTLLVRHGGDEFVALLVDIRSPLEATHIAERLRKSLSRTYTIDDQRFDLTASIGVAVAKAADLEDGTLLQHADLALYAAKSAGRNRVASFDANLAHNVDNELRQRRLLREAIDEERVVMHFQPLVDVGSGKTTGYESLARIAMPDGTLVLPGDFLPASMNTGLILELDRVAFSLSCQAASVLARAAVGRPPTIACNFAGLSLTQPGTLTFIEETMAEHGVAESQICIEITESAAFEAGDVGLSLLSELYRRGLSIALDDFGTGYSSLAHLRDLPITSVKVDRSFISELPLYSSERAIADAVVTLANELGLNVVAEGVETAEQLAHARAMGFHTIQGWCFAPAMPLTDAVAALIST